MKSREKGPITKEHIATHAHLILMAYIISNNTFLWQYKAEIITVTQEASLPLNASLPIQSARPLLKLKCSFLLVMYNC